MSDQPHYPYRDGDHAVLGPEVIATADGMTICWKGAKYRRDHGEHVGAATPLICSDERHTAKVAALQAAIARVRAAVTILEDDMATAQQAGHELAAYALKGAVLRITAALDGPAPAATQATQPHTGRVVEPYRNDRGEQAWVFRCWGTDDGCDGWLSLDHHSQQSAERARDRHVTEEHAEPGELTADEARTLADELGLDLYRAQDALAFVGECCTIAEREQRPITTADVREWLKGARCGRQLAADAAAAADQPEPATVTDPEYLRQQCTAVIRRWWDADDGGAEEIADAVMRVRDRHLAQLRLRLRLADELLATRDAELAAAKKTARGIGAWGVLQAIEQALPNGPTVAECADSDRQWPLQKHGE